VKAAACLALLAALAGPAGGQASGPGSGAPPAPPAAPAPGGGTAAADAEGKAADAATAEGLFSTTLAGDIRTASYYELVAWCRSLGLEESGSRKDLQARLAAHYHVSLEEPKAKEGRRITVRSAKDSQYFTLEAVGEKYVVLRGDVVLEIADPQTDAVQQIKTQSLTFNQTRNTVTATGGVEYSITQSGKTQTFSGVSLTFNVESGEGAFYDGKTTRQQKRGEKDVTFSFQGTTITRLDNDTVIMDEGSITTCDLEDPHFQVRATRVWILAPGEWAAQNAVLYIGRVPVMYLPVFFFPGDSILFDPAFGYDLRKGSYIQTTTYLMGKKKQQSGGLSFLQLAQPDDAAYDQELRGIFLHKVPAAKGARPDGGATLKLMADAYSRLGLYAGLAGDFPPAASFRVGMGASRSLFLGTTGVYSPFYIESDGSDSMYWNSSSIFGFTIPFRFGMEASVKASADTASVSVGFEYFSDPYFTQDFHSRSEGLQLTTDLNALLSQSQTVPLKSNLSWDVTSRADLSKGFHTPLLQSLTIPNANLKLTWQSRETPTVAGSAAASDPGRIFYYPSSLVAPSVSLSASGELFRLGGSPAAATPSAAAPGAAAPTGQGPAGSTLPAGPGAPQPAPSASGAGAAPRPDPGRGLHAPLPLQAGAGMAPGQGKSAPRPARFDIKAPQRSADLPATGQQTETTASITYQVTPRANLEQTFDSSAWAAQKNVDFKLLYGTLETGGSGRLTGNLTLPDRVLDATASLAVDGTYRVRYSPNPGAAYQALRVSDLLQDQVSVRGILQTTVRPFYSFAPLAGSTLSYRINQRLLQVKLSGSDPDNPVVTALGPEWTTSSGSVTEHGVQASLALAALGQTQTLSLSAQLPPLLQSLTGRFDGAAWILKGSIQGGAAQTSVASDAWTPQPLVTSAVLDLGKDASFSQDLQYDLTAGAFSKTTTQARLWGLSSAFTAQTLLPTNGYGAAVSGAVQAFLPSTFRVAYDYSGASMYFWRNRIKFDATLRSSWNMNLQKFSDNTLDFSLSLNLSIYKFLDISFSSVSSNKRMYQYFPAWASALGVATVDPLTDLLRSFNFFNTSDRYQSAFKVSSLSIKGVHHLHDWDITLEYQGSPQLKSVGGFRQYQWTPVFAIRVQWNAIPEIQTTTSGDAGGLNLRGASATTQATTL
jgi:lipopolysaccharide assembly outer membrane protein LptD (OstA)